ncbi:hypothetical protein P7K49_032253 [Saguinus oedipus]|uniref:Uncharacterized protein n=1 Tax=Saguinus oedipus TaxID=9490 RepID=A0ABQ9TZL8_SAGOE|nr:hypothetical protein P7K49_032253 [Saguinus oedipus]
MEDGLAGPLHGAAAAAAEARARPGVTLRPFAPLSGTAEADEGGGDWSFIDCEMEEVDLQDLPSATIACHLDPRVFVDGLCRVRVAGGPSGRRADTCCLGRRRGSQRPGPGRVWGGEAATPPGPPGRGPCPSGPERGGGSPKITVPEHPRGARSSPRGPPQALPARCALRLVRLGGTAAPCALALARLLRAVEGGHLVSREEETDVERRRDSLFINGTTSLHSQSALLEEKPMFG